MVWVMLFSGWTEDVADASGVCPCDWTSNGNSGAVAPPQATKTSMQMLAASLVNVALIIGFVILSIFLDRQQQHWGQISGLSSCESLSFRLYPLAGAYLFHPTTYSPDPNGYRYHFCIWYGLYR